VGTLRTGDYIFFYGRGHEKHQSGTVSFVHHRIVRAVKTGEFVSDGMSYIVIRSHWRIFFKCTCTK